MKHVNWFIVILISLVVVAWSTAMAQEVSSKFDYIPPTCGPVTFIIDDDEGSTEVSGGQDNQLEPLSEGSVQRYKSYKSTQQTEEALLTVSIECASQQSEPFKPGLSVGLCGDTCGRDSWAACITLCEDGHKICVLTTGNVITCQVLYDQCFDLCNDVAWDCVGECSGFDRFDSLQSRD